MNKKKMGFLLLMLASVAAGSFLGGVFTTPAQGQYCVANSCGIKGGVSYQWEGRHDPDKFTCGYAWGSGTCTSTGENSAPIISCGAGETMQQISGLLNSGLGSTNQNRQGEEVYLCFPNE